MNDPRNDPEELASRFTIQELRKELHVADVNCLPDQIDYGYWSWYKDTVEAAIKIIKSRQPKPIIKPGYVDIEALKERIDIVSLAEEYSIRLHKSGKNFKARCPFHNDKEPSFYIYPEEKRFYCFGCQADGDFIDLVMRLDNISFKEAVRNANDRS